MTIKHWSFAEQLKARLGRFERSSEPIRIDTPEQLAEFQRQLDNGWHEPDQWDLDARVYGMSFDNAGFWGKAEFAYKIIEEQHVVFMVEDHPVAAVNLADLCDWATSYGAGSA